MQRTLERLARCVFWLLIAIGLLTSLGRYFLSPEAHAQVARPAYGRYVEQFPVMSTHPITEAMHRIGGALYLVIGIAQFTPKLRTRYRWLHRLLGRIFLLLAVASFVSAVIMVVKFPYSGLQESVPIVFFGAMMLYCAYRGYRHARRREIARHREWVIRAYAIGLGVATIRVVYVVFMYTMPITTQECFITSVWLGFVLTVVAAEVWLNYTRSKLAKSTPT